MFRSRAWVAAQNVWAMKGSLPNLRLNWVFSANVA